jgi:hypothetical protein
VPVTAAAISVSQFTFSVAALTSKLPNFHLLSTLYLVSAHRFVVSLHRQRIFFASVTILSHHFILVIGYLSNPFAGP